MTLTTDFGTRDPYVASMKGVILTLAPRVTLVDITHEIPPQDIREGMRAIHEAHRYFPSETIHIVVVDPGVGSARRILCVSTDQGMFLAPDNGVLTGILEEFSSPKIVVVERDDLCLPTVSATFHGRDIFAPIAAHLALGLDPNDLGPPTKTPTLLPRRAPIVDVLAGRIRGEIVHIDHFGNLITNITLSQVEVLQGDLRVAVESNVESHPVPIQSTYSDFPPGELGALLESTGHLEIAIHGGSAAATLGVSVGAPVEVESRPGTDEK